MRQRDNYKVIDIFQDIISSTRDGIAFLDEMYRYVVINEAYEKMSGISREAIIGLTVSEYLGREIFERSVKERFDRCLQGETITYQEWFDYPLSGRRYMEVSYVPCRDRQKRIIGVIANSRDITDRHHLADEQRVTLSLLQALHEHTDIQGLACRAVELIQEWSGCDAVGIRLERSDDLSYYETRGFPTDFISAETRLRAEKVSGEIRCDRKGYTELECLCGQLLGICLDSDVPDFTENGSSWTNSLPERSGSEQRACRMKGYQSVALIPLRDGRQSRGLLQINDRRKGVFTARHIAVFERLAANLALGFSQRINAQVLKENEQKYKGLVTNLPGTAYQFLLSASGKQCFTFIGGGCEELFGLSAAEIVADSNRVFAAVPPDDASRVQEAITRSAETFCRYDVEHRIHHESGRIQWIRAISTPRRLAGGETIWDGIAINITQRKNAEQDLLQLYRDIQIREQTAKLFLTAPAERLFNDVLDILLERFGAAFGYIGYIDANGDLVCPSMSREIWQECRMAEKSIIFPRQKWGGIWGESLLKKISLRRNGNLKTPPGHVMLENALVVPILFDEELVGQIALADTPAGVTADMQSQLESFAEFIGPVLQMYLEKEKMHEELRRSLHKLKQTNIALNVMIDNSNDSKNELSRKILQSFNTLVFPYFETLSQSHSRTDIMMLLEIIRENIQASLHVLDTPVSVNHIHFSPREMQVAQLVKSGKSSKEIAAILRISPRAVFFHRNTIRKKLGIHKAKTNLRTYLLHLDA